MKNNFILDLLPWVGLPLLLASLIAWGIAPAYPGDAAHHAAPKPAAKMVAANVVNDADVQELKGRLKELEDANRQNYMLELDGQRKQVEWLLTFLGILVGIIALFGTLFPLLLGRKNKEIIEQDITQIKQLLADAESSVEKIRQHETEAASRNEKITKHQEMGTQPAPEMLQAVEETIKDKSSDPLMRLRAEAISAGQAKDADKAYALWVALTKLAPSDANAQFNAGYWAGMLGENQLAAEKLHWLKLVQQHSKQALSLKPDMHYAANNWGAALAAEAKALAATELAGARALWKQAGEKYQLALSLKPDKHEAANNWGYALLFEVNAIAASNPEHSTQLLDQAEQLLLAHADAVPEMMAYNLACVYGRRADVKGCLKWLRVSQAHGNLPDCAHLNNDQDLVTVRNAPEFIAWFKQVCP